MNEHGKSDRPAVLVKSPNNTGQPVAEGMEGKGLAKGNLPQQHAPRTPSRVGALSALERVRHAARQDRKLRFTALLHHVYDHDALRAAYLGLKREAAPGVDGETIGNISGVCGLTEGLLSASAPPTDPQTARQRTRPHRHSNDPARK